MKANTVKTGAIVLRTKKCFEIRTRLQRYVAPHNVRQCFLNASCNARVCIMHALLQWNICIYNAALCVEISSRNNKS